jgi:hypothetical protein
MYINIILAVIILACAASLFNDGLWSNAVRLIYVIMSALLAMNYYEPLARTLEKWQPSYTFVWDFLSLWGLFTIFAIIFKLLTDKLSQVKVKFLKIVDQVGSVVLSLWIGWVMVCFTLTTFHTAPLSPNFTPLDFKPEERAFVGLAPDRQWLGFTQKQSLGCYGHSPSNNPDKYAFDPDGKFLLNYKFRRTKLESKNNKNDSIRINRSDSWWMD